LGEYDRAIANYRRSLDLRPDNADAHYNLGMIYGAKGMIKEMQAEMAISRRLRAR
jgi:tetratricopeptide (TPR) repeat protein